MHRYVAFRANILFHQGITGRTLNDRGMFRDTRDAGGGYRGRHRPVLWLLHGFRTAPGRVLR